MKVGLLKTSPPPALQLSGVSRYIAELTPRLNAAGVETAVFWLEGEGAGSREVPYRRPRPGWPRYRALHGGDRALARSLGTWTLAERPQLLHVHWSFLEAMALLKLLPPGAPPALVSLHTYEAVCPLKTHVTARGRPCDALPGAVCLRERCRTPVKWLAHDLPLRRLRRGWAGRAAGYLTHNRELTELVRELGLGPVHYLPLGADLPPEPAPHPRAPVLLYAGRLRPEKGLAVLAAALPEILRATPEAVVRIAGDGPLREDLVRAVPAGAEHRVHFLGTLEREALGAEYAAARVVAVPSLWKENFALVGPEAMSHGTPVVGSDLGGIREWLRSGENGLAVPAGDPKALAEAVGALLRDPERAAALGAGALETARDFSMDRHVEGLVPLYREILERTGRGGP
jgi:glycosyltransferase involved in cell wall biosynthesis